MKRNKRGSQISLRFDLDEIGFGLRLGLAHTPFARLHYLPEPGMTLNQLEVGLVPEPLGRPPKAVVQAAIERPHRLIAAPKHALHARDPVSGLGTLFGKFALRLQRGLEDLFVFALSI